MVEVMDVLRGRWWKIFSLICGHYKVKKDAWCYTRYGQVNLENGVCATFCNFNTVHVQVDVFIVVYVAEKLVCDNLV